MTTTQHPGQQPPDLDSPGAAVREIAYIAREARALVGSDDGPRREAFLARKRALLDHIDRGSES